MLGLQKSFRIAVGAVLLLGLATATAACGAPGTPTSCTAGDDPVLISAVATTEGEDLRYVPLILECGPDETVTITDEDGNEYESLEDFQANNELLDDGDMMTVPANFPAMNGYEQAGYTTVEGRTGGIPGLWWWVGGSALVAVAIAVGIARFERRRGARTPDINPE